MSITLQITDETTTVNLADGNTGKVPLDGYQPLEPEIRTVEVASLTQDGSEQTAITYANVVETADVILLGGIAAARATKNALTLLFEQARLRQNTGLGERVFVKFKPDAGDTLYRSEILSGSIELDPKTLNVTSGHWAAGQIPATITWTRRYYWERDLETAIPVSNGNGSNNTTGLTIYNHNDSGTGHDNYVEIAGADVPGELPAPAIIEIENTYASNRARRWFIGHHVTGTPGSFNPIMEAEGATHSGTQQPGVADPANYSNGFYVTDSIDATEAEVFRWPRSAAQLGYAAGGRFLLLARFVGDRRDIWFRVRIQYQSTTLWDSEPFQVDDTDDRETKPLCVVQLPPWRLADTSSVGLDVVLYARTASGGGTVALDYLHLMPLDGFLDLRAVYGLANTHKLKIDGVEGTVYTDTGVGFLVDFIPTGGPIMLRPGKLQRLYFLAQENTGPDAVNRTSKIKVWIRRRRLTL